MAPQPSMLRRLALPLGLSLACHTLLVGVFCALQIMPAAATSSGSSDWPTISLHLGLARNVRPSRGRRPRPADLDDATPVELTSTIVHSPVQAQGGTVSATSSPPEETSGGGDSGHDRLAKRGMGRGLLSVPGVARRIVYLVDRSISMGPSGALATAVEEVAASLSTLPANALFQVIPYNRMAEPLKLDGKRDLAPASPATIEQAIELLGQIQPAGPTDNALALRHAFQLRPDVVFILTDADELPAIELPLLMRMRGNAALHVIQLTHDVPGPSDGPLARLACGPSDSYRRVLPGR